MSFQSRLLLENKAHYRSIRFDIRLANGPIRSSQRDKKFPAAKPICPRRTPLMAQTAEGVLSKEQESREELLSPFSHIFKQILLFLFSSY